ncbi:MAG TPA: flavin-dependent oxidoreductase [Stackebrandtia sp.]|jgi:2-polyprenyl-6-methoxyphenol hydroxylase-like FAD-dependent oxidoreductase|uniref:flavin-dependent oxidoreductase n=1 Tax=Stackebrandtia sp. TaxID=2023065 RepID=UPI002D49AD49|nr:flavin-dependent oxidoreductase [Stackebrandtia sp.]HZE40365.1 flavin-dependent oxidoreductase [Stackebrandtia sp.]
MANVLVIGAGIGGLSAALSLHAAGIECAVVDRVPELTPAGVGINLQPAAVRELTELGLGDELARLGVATAEFVHYDRFGNRIWGEPRGIAAGYRWPQYSIHRGQLQMMLLRTVRRRLGSDAVATGIGFESCEQDGNRVRVRLVERADGAETRIDAAAVIGADGLYSAVRAQLHPDEGAPIGNGIRMWRGVNVQKPYRSEASMVVAGRNSAAKFVAYPIAPTVDGLTTINWVAEVRLPDDGRVADWTARGELSDVLPHYADWDFGWLDVPGLIAASDPILEYPMVDRDPLPHWGNGRVTLLGDAAHPMYPIGSNGGSQAILDARVLAHRLATEPNVETALSAYEAERREATTAIVLANRGMGPESVLRTVAERAPQGFSDIADILSAEELAGIEDAYLRTTGIDVERLNARPSWSVPRPS